jgi:hypothetical protein
MDPVIRAIIEAKYDKYVARIVYRLRRVPAKDWDGDESAMRTLWDHWKREMQEEHSAVHELIENMVEGIVLKTVDQMPHDEGALLTLGTDALDDLEEEPQEPVLSRDAVAEELLRRVNSRASEEPHRREVQRLLDDQACDRFERDNETYR